MMSRIWLSYLAYLGVGLFSLMLAVFVASGLVRASSSKTQSTYTLSQNTTAQVVPPASAIGSVTAANSSIGLTSTNFLEPYIFDTREGRRNPFRPPVMVKDQEVITPGTPLERYEIDEIKLVAIMWDIKAPKAMFIDPTGAMHVIGKDDRIGRRQGYIATIRESEVVVVETTNFNGELAYATRILRIDIK